MARSELAGQRRHLRIRRRTNRDGARVRQCRNNFIERIGFGNDAVGEGCAEEPAKAHQQLDSFEATESKVAVELRRSADGVSRVQAS